MNQFTVNSVLLLLLHLIVSTFGNVKITPIAVDNKSNGNMKSDLKVEEARFRDPVMPEYYDRNRQGFVTSTYDDSYGGSAFDRYGYSNYYNRINSNNNFDRYGTKYGYDNKFGGIYSGSSLENKFNQLGGYGNKFGYGGPVYGPYGNPSNLGPISGSFSGLIPPELEAKGSILLPLAGAALLGIAAYAIVTNPGIATAAAGPAIGKRRKRSLFDEKIEQHLAYRAHKKASQKHH